MHLTTRRICAGFLALAHAMGVHSAVMSSYSNSSDPTTTIHITSKITSTITQTASPCCFVVQDTVSENAFSQYDQETSYRVVNFTSVTTFITPYPQSTLTSITTNTYTTNRSFEYEKLRENNPIQLYQVGGANNDAPGVPQTSTRFNGSQTVVGGTTIQSPAAFYQYNSLRVIEVPAVTDANGQLVCATTSTIASVVTLTSASTFFFPTSTSTDIYTVTNTYSSTPASGPAVPATTSAVTVSLTNIYYSASISYGGVYSTHTLTNRPTIVYTGINSNIQAYFAMHSTAAETDAGTVIQLTTPLVYLPDRGATGASSGLSVSVCAQTDALASYGYPPQAIINSLGSNPYYNSIYPGIGKCLPGGPSILPLTACSAVAPHVEGSGGDLTSSTVITVTPTLVPAEPVSTTPASPASPASSTEIPPATSTPESTPSSTPEAPASTHVSTEPQESNPAETPTSIAVVETTMPADTTTPVSSAPVSQPAESPPEPSTPASVEAPGSSPVAPFPETTPASVDVPGSSPSPETTQASVGVPASSPAAPSPETNPASAIASIIGASPVTTVIGGTTQLVASGSVTLPASSGLSGLTTVISGSTQVVVPTALTVPLPQASQVTQAVQPLPGSTTEVSGTMNVVITGSTMVPVNSELPGLTGSTTVISSSTYIIVSSPTTVPVVPMSPTTSAAGGANSTAPLQITPGSAASRKESALGLVMSSIFVLLAMVLV